MVVPFEKDRGNLWGASSEPFVSKPARHPEHDGNNTQLRDKVGAKMLHDQLTWINQASANEMRDALALVCKLGRQHLANQPQAVVAGEVNLGPVIEFCDEFLRESDGGVRLAAITYAFATVLYPDFEVKVYSPNQADKFGRAAGDVEVFSGKKIMVAFECKDRPFTNGDLQHGIAKAIQHKVPQYLFISGTSKVAATSNPQDLGALKGVNSTLLFIRRCAKAWAAVMLPQDRSQFGKAVVEACEIMRRRNSAKAAEKIWNDAVASE